MYLVEPDSGPGPAEHTLWLRHRTLPSVPVSLRIFALFVLHVVDYEVGIVHQRPSSFVAPKTEPTSGKALQCVRLRHTSLSWSSCSGRSRSRRHHLNYRRMRRLGHYWVTTGGDQSPDLALQW